VKWRWGWWGGGSLRVVVKEGVKDHVGEDGVLVVELVVVRGFFVYMVSLLTFVQIKQ